MNSEETEQRISQLHQQLRTLAEQGRYRETVPLAAEVLDLSKGLWSDEENLLVHANSLHINADFYRLSGYHAEAELRYQQALLIYETLFGRDPLEEHAQSLHELACQIADGRIECPNCDPPGLDWNLVKAGLVSQVARGDDLPYYAASQYHLACVYVSTGRLPQALDLMRRAATSDDFMIEQVLSIGSEAQRAAFLRRVQTNTNLFLSLVLSHFLGSPEVVRDGLELVLRRKALGVEALVAQRDAGRDSSRPHVGELVRQVDALRCSIAEKALSDPGPEGVVAYRRSLAELESQRDRLEIKLARQTLYRSSRRRYLNDSLRTIQHSLPLDAALVEFVRFTPFAFDAVPARGEEAWRPPRYLAFVLLGSGTPRLLDLGEASPIDHLIAAFRARVVQRSSGRNLVPAAPAEMSLPSGDHDLAVRAALFDPLLEALGGRRKLVLCPDSELCRVPFGALPAPGGGQLLDVYRICYLGVGRDLCRPARRKAVGTPPLVIADPDFDLGVELPAARPGQPRAGHDADAVPGRRSARLEGSRISFGRLPGTRVEGERVARTLGAQAWFGGLALDGRL
jgi:hypothetical protein